MRKMNPKSLENLRLSKRRGLKKNLQLKVTEEMKARLDALPPELLRSWLQEKLDGRSGDDTVANELIERVRRGVFDGLPELQELVRRVGLEDAIKVIYESARISLSEANDDSLNRALALTTACRMALILNERDQPPNALDNAAANAPVADC